MKTSLLVGAFSLLAAVAAVGWTRKLPSPDAAAQALNVQPSALQPLSNLAGNSAGATYTSVSSNSSAYTGASRTHVAPREYTSRSDVSRSTVKPRSTKRSVAVVAGSSGVGAAIGALAGGGRGAAIGALAGGAGGFIYDRLTHKHPVLF